MTWKDLWLDRASTLFAVVAVFNRSSIPATPAQKPINRGMLDAACAGMTDEYVFAFSRHEFARAI
jgi:hypothetical protein